MFLADRLPTRPVASLDLCPVTHRARPSYRRAAEIFEQSTRCLVHPDAPEEALAGLGGWTLHQLRHSQLTAPYQLPVIAAGVDIKIVQEMLGHSTSAFTLDVYTSVVPEIAAAAAEAVAAIVPRRANSVPTGG